MMKVAITRLDKLFSDYIRQRAILRVHGCERCLTWKASYKQLQCSHFWGRGEKSVRYDEDNAAGLCGACHMYLGSHPNEHRDFFLERLGEDGFNLLMLRANGVNKADLTAIEIYLRQKIKELQAVISVDKL